MQTILGVILVIVFMIFIGYLLHGVVNTKDPFD